MKGCGVLQVCIRHVPYGESRGKVQNSNEMEFVLVADVSDALLWMKIFLREGCLELHPGMVGTRLQDPFQLFALQVPQGQGSFNLCLFL